MRISIIIPTLNEAERVADVVARARALGEESEVIVVDGGSDDGTLDLADAADVTLTTERGRAIQQNAGAAAAAGEVLLFLHADCWLESGALNSVRSILEDETVAGGCFRQAIDASGVRFRLLEFGNGLRVNICKWAYGDQGIFLRRDLFEQVGGFPDVAFMEDLLLMKRLKRLGRIALLDQRIHVSARRWQSEGVIRQTLRNWSLITLAHCGVSPNRLARLYPHVR